MFVKVKRLLMIVRSVFEGVKGLLVSLKSLFVNVKSLLVEAKSLLEGVKRVTFMHGVGRLLLLVKTQIIA